MNKKILILTLLFTTKFIVTSCIKDDIGSCPSQGPYDVVYSELIIKSSDNTTETREIQDSVFFDSYNLAIDLHGNILTTTSATINLNFLKFSSALALDCLPIQYNVEDPVSSIEILVLDTDNETEVNVTGNFIGYYIDNEVLSPIELVKKAENSDDGDPNISLSLSLVNYENLPKHSIFTVKITLDSGLEFIQKTEKINFF